MRTSHVASRANQRARSAWRGVASCCGIRTRSTCERSCTARGASATASMATSGSAAAPSGRSGRLGRSRRSFAAASSGMARACSCPTSGRRGAETASRNHPPRCRHATTSCTLCTAAYSSVLPCAVRLSTPLYVYSAVRSACAAVCGRALYSVLCTLYCVCVSDARARAHAHAHAHGPRLLLHPRPVLFCQRSAF